MMTCAQFDRELDGWLDGDLSPEAAAGMQKHLDDCEACRVHTEQMRAVMTAAGALPRTIAPPRDLWYGIAGRMEQRPVRHQIPQARSWRRWVPLAAAAVVLMAVTATLTWRMARQPTPIAGPTGPGVLRPAGFAADHDYVLAAEDLERVLDEGRSRLSPETVTVIEQNLALIDAAIAEARAALAADPANADLRALLWGAHRHKLDLLDRATRLTRS